MKKYIFISVITVALLSTALIFNSCHNEGIDPMANTTSEKQTETLNYKTLKIENFTSDEIGKLHNSYLQEVLKENEGKSQQSKLYKKNSELLFALRKKNIDPRISDAQIESSINNLFQNNIFTKNLSSTSSKAKNINSFQEDVLAFLVSKGEITEEGRLEIITLSKLNIDEMKIHVNRLIISNKYSDGEKKYFAVYVSIYENSRSFWIAQKATSDTSKQKQDWEPYLADAIGGVLGLYGGPIWSICQGALASYIMS